MLACKTLAEVSPELLQAGDDLDSTGQAFFTDLYTMIDTLPLPYKSPACLCLEQPKADGLLTWQ